MSEYVIDESLMDFVDKTSGQRKQLGLNASILKSTCDEASKRCFSEAPSHDSRLSESSDSNDTLRNGAMTLDEQN